MTKRSVLYARVSSDDTKREGRNLAGQLEMCRKYATEHGYEIIAELHEDDRGASGAAFELERLNRVRDMARAGDFDVLIVREIDRLSRSLAKQLVVEEELRRAGVQIEYVLGEYPDSPEGRLNKHIKATIAEYEREKINERMTRGRVLKVQAGSVMVHGRPPYGYRYRSENGKFALVIEEAEASIVRLIFQWYTTGDGAGGALSMTAIKNALDAMCAPTYEDTRQVHTKKRKHGVWARGTISKILSNETYAGLWRYHRDFTQDAALSVTVPALISRETFAQAQVRMDHNRTSLRRKSIYDYLMSGRLRCVHCGARLVANSQTATRRYYICHAKREISHSCEVGPRAHADDVDAIVWGWVRSFLLDPQKLADGLESYRERQEAEHTPIRTRLKVVEDLIRENRTQLERLLDLYLSGDFSKDLLTERRTRIETTIGALEKERAGLADYLTAHLLTADQIADLQDFAAKIAVSLEGAESDFATRRRAIETLNVEGTLAYEDGKKVLWVSCELAQPMQFIVNGQRDEVRVFTPRCHPGSSFPWEAALWPAARLYRLTGCPITVGCRGGLLHDCFHPPAQEGTSSGLGPAGLSAPSQGPGFSGVIPPPTFLRHRFMAAPMAIQL